MRNNSHTLGFAMLQQATMLGFQFLSFLILVRILSPELMGIWSLYLTFHAFFETGRTGFIHNGLIKYLVGNTAQTNEIFTAAFIWQFVLSILMCMIFGVIATAFYPQLQAPLLVTMALYYPLVAFPSGLHQLLQTYQTSRQNFKVIWISSLGISMINFLGVITYSLSPGSPSLMWLVGFQAGSYLLGAFILLYFSRKNLRLTSFTREWFYKLFHFGKYSIGTGLGSMIYKKIDILMIGFMINPQAVGLYSVASRIINYLEVPLTAIAQVYYPRVSKQMQATPQQAFPTQIIQQAIAWMMWIIVPLGLILLIFPGAIIRLLAGEAYLAAAPILQIFAIITLVKPFGRMVGITIDAMGRPDLNMKLLLGSIVCNMIVNYLLIQYMGMMGAALGTLISTWLVIFSGQYIVSKIFGFSYAQFLKGTLQACRYIPGILLKTAFNRVSSSS